METNSVNFNTGMNNPVVQNVQNNVQPQAVKTESIQAKGADKEAPKGDVFVIAGKEINKKDAVKYGGAAAFGLGAITTAGIAFKKGRIINGENSKFFSNISEGIKAMFTKAGKEKYKKALETISQGAPADAASRAGKGKRKIFGGKKKSAPQPQAPIPTRKDVVDDLMKDFNNGDEGAKKVVKSIVDSAQKQAIKEKTDKLYKDLEPEISTILGDDFKNALIKASTQAHEKGGVELSNDAVLNIGKEFSKDELKKIMAKEGGAEKLVKYMQTKQVLSGAADASKKLLQSIING